MKKYGYIIIFLCFIIFVVVSIQKKTYYSPRSFDDVSVAVIARYFIQNEFQLSDDVEFQEYFRFQVKPLPEEGHVRVTCYSQEKDEKGLNKRTYYIVHMKKVSPTEWSLIDVSVDEDKTMR